MNEKQKERLLQIIDESNNIVFFGGAGVSTASGIPDFRSKNGLYNQHDVQFEKYSPEYLLSRSCLYDNSKVFYEFYRQKLDTRGIEPNIAHTCLMKMEEIGKLKAVITQNIDGLHQMAVKYMKFMEQHKLTIVLNVANVILQIIFLNAEKIFQDVIANGME